MSYSKTDKMKHSVRIAILSLCSFFLVLSIKAQETQLGLNVGFSNYKGDISKTIGAFSLGQYRPAAGIYLRQKHNPYFTTRFGLQYGQATASDETAINEARRLRNLSFVTNIFEVGLMEEFNILGFDYYEGKYFSPYIFLGIAGYYFNPKTEYLGRLYELQPLGTEGQGIPGFGPRYEKYQIAIPFGFGFKYALTEEITISLELGGRKLFTDYLDDVSGTYVTYQTLLEYNGELSAILAHRGGEFLGTEPLEVPTGTVRGNPDFKDWYFFSLFGVSWTIFKKDYNPYYRPRKKRLGCPW